MELQFHHINYVSENIEELDMFYQNIMQMEAISPEKFPRTTATDKAGYDGKIKFVTEGTMQMHLAEQDLTVANKHNQEINPIEKGHIAFRTDDEAAAKCGCSRTNVTPIMKKLEKLVAITLIQAGKAGANSTRAALYKREA